MLPSIVNSTQVSHYCRSQSLGMSVTGSFRGILLGLLPQFDFTRRNVAMGSALVVFAVICLVVGLSLIASGQFRVLSILVLSAVAVFSCFGFLASFEPIDGAVYFRTGYAATIVASVAGIVRVLTAASVDPRKQGSE
jgi:hypothetical protein